MFYAQALVPGACLGHVTPYEWQAPFLPPGWWPHSCHLAVAMWLPLCTTRVQLPLCSIWVKACTCPLVPGPGGVRGLPIIPGHNKAKLGWVPVLVSLLYDGIDEPKDRLLPKEPNGEEPWVKRPGLHLTPWEVPCRLAEPAPGHCTAFLSRHSSLAAAERQAMLRMRCL